jgi:hypothetical protein
LLLCFCLIITIVSFCRSGHTSENITSDSVLCGWYDHESEKLHKHPCDHLNE